MLSISLLRTVLSTPGRQGLFIVQREAELLEEPQQLFRIHLFASLFCKRTPLFGVRRHGEPPGRGISQSTLESEPRLSNIAHVSIRSLQGTSPQETVFCEVISARAEQIMRTIDSSCGPSDRCECNRPCVPAENSITLKSVNSAREGTTSSVSENTCRITECERPRRIGSQSGGSLPHGICIYLYVYIKEEAMAQAARRSYRW
jgi:hypothetical protein